MGVNKGKVLAILAKCGGSLSFIGSLLIIRDIVKKGKKNLNAFRRIMFGLSCGDIISSIGNILSTWPTPADQTYIWGAAGTTETCTAQGFFNELGNMGAVLYSASLSIYYVWTMTQGMKRKPMPKKSEFALHVVPITIAAIMAIAGLPFLVYNNAAGFNCWYGSYPTTGCSMDGTCTRGEHADIFRWVHYAIVWAAIIVVICCMVVIYMVVRDTEKKANFLTIAAHQSSSLRRSSLRSNASSADSVIDCEDPGNVEERTSRRKKKQPRSETTRKVANQAMLYIAALFVTWFFTTLLRLSQTISGVTNYWMVVMMALLFPLQGFWNALIYFRSQRQGNTARRRRSTKLSSKNANRASIAQQQSGGETTDEVSKDYITNHPSSEGVPT
mmetsp:Transcript_12950/g.21455  ORF Transcript_12950/g.21455 Transcript_12950/m.21455 type:complete len:386 (+) Transcript_12950:102-1259(+)